MGVVRRTARVKRLGLRPPYRSGGLHIDPLFYADRLCAASRWLAAGWRARPARTGATDRRGKTGVPHKQREIRGKADEREHAERGVAACYAAAVDGDVLRGAAAEPSQTRTERTQAGGTAKPQTYRASAAEQEAAAGAELDDKTLLDKALRDPKTRDVYNGAWKGYNFPSQSEADLWLLTGVRVRTGKNKPQMVRLFESSNLVRDKWHDRENYRDPRSRVPGTCTDVYTPSSKGAARAARASCGAGRAHAAASPGEEQRGEARQDSGEHQGAPDTQGSAEGQSEAESHVESGASEEAGRRETGAEKKQQGGQGQSKAFKSAGECSSQAARLIQIATDISEFFHTPERVGYARVRVNDHYENFKINSSAYREVLSRETYNRLRQAPRRESMAEVLNVLEANARYDGKCIQVYLRVAPLEGGGIAIDLGNDIWNAVEVTAVSTVQSQCPPSRFPPQQRHAGATVSRAGR